jgi:chorismate mutase
MATDAEKLSKFRVELDSLDEQLVALLGRRYEICRDVARFKKEHKIPMMQSGRVAAVKERCARLGDAHNVDPDFVARLYSLIIGESCRLEDEIIDGSTS